MYFIYFWLRRVLVAACGIFRCGAPALHRGAPDLGEAAVSGGVKRDLNSLPRN